ncbi:gamma-glutamyl-gamma-aminobutyrate hydrolase family protein, partial [Pseudomonas syringae]
GPGGARGSGFEDQDAALGGGLHRRVRELPGYLDDREPISEGRAVQYAPKHAVQVQPGSLLDSLGLAPGFEVNSLHSQGSDRMASDLCAEALAPDGLVEAVSSGERSHGVGYVRGSMGPRRYGRGVSLSLFKAFREACQRYARSSR